MGTKSKFFRVFVEGATISDGRQITAEMIDDIVATFNAETYTPRINVEHISGYSPEPPFNGYGDVIAVKAQTDDITIDGKTEKRKALYAQVEANDQLMALAERDQKPFPSVELTGSYAGTGKVGIVAMAFTDNPASIATQRLKFSSHAPGTVFASGSAPASIEFEATQADPREVERAIDGYFGRLIAKFRPAEPEAPKEPPTPANDNFDAAAFAADMKSAVSGALAAALKPVTDAQATLQRDFAKLQSQLEDTEQPGTFSRTPATGGSTDAQYLTDC